MFFKRNGRPCSYEEWSELLNDPEYRTIKVTELPNGTTIETSWVGISGESFYTRRRGLSEHLIFVTTLTLPKPGKKAEKKYFHYASETEAKAGHAAITREYGGG
jgi:hypothetical protein